MRKINFGSTWLRPRPKYLNIFEVGGPGESENGIFHCPGKTPPSPRQHWFLSSPDGRSTQCYQNEIADNRRESRVVSVEKRLRPRGRSAPVFGQHLKAPFSTNTAPNSKIITHIFKFKNSFDASGGIAMKMISVTILNWDKFNPRTDRANYTWFRFQNDFFQSQNLFGLSDSQMVLFMICLCEASKKNKSTIDINLDYVASLRRQSIKKITEDFQELALRAVIAPAESRQEAGSEPSLLLATNVRTNVRDIRTNDNAQSDDFADFYSGYPRKVGRAKAEKTYKAAIKNGAKHEDIIFAREAYRMHLAKNKTEEKFILHASTFMNQWADWLAPDAGLVEAFAVGQTFEERMRGVFDGNE